MTRLSCKNFSPKKNKNDFFGILVHAQEGGCGGVRRRSARKVGDVSSTAQEPYKGYVEKTEEN